MAIVKEWARPLEDALTEQLKATDPDPEALERVRQTAALLNGAPLSGKLERRLAEVTEQLERSYQAAARAVTQSATSDAVERGILSLTRYRGYRDADRILEEGRQRADALRAQEQAKARAARRRRTGIVAAIAVATIAVIAFFIVRSTLQNQRITQRVAQAQALADEGNTPGALDALNALAGEGVKGVSHPDIYALTETVLENTARQDGFEAAYALYDDLGARFPDIIRSTDFNDYAVDWLENPDTAIADRWGVLQLVEAHGRKVSADLRDGIVAAYLDTLPADEAWAIASQRVEDGQLAPDSDIAASALESALAEVSGAQAWDIARRAVELKVTDRDSELAQAAFSAYLATLPPEEAWNAVYTARRDGTQSISDEAFMAVYTAYADTVPVDRLWSDFIGYVRDGKLDLFPAEAPRQALSAYLRLLSDELAAGSDRDMAAWAEEQAEALNAVAADPDAALTFVYALKDAGRDPAALFPSGLLVDIPVADRVCSLVNRLTNSLSPGRTPNVSTVLPVSIVQKSNTLSSISTDDRLGLSGLSSLPGFAGSSFTNQSSLNSKVNQILREDGNYAVRLLPQYLFRLPEALRPAGFADCESLLCMQNTYLYSGSITHTSTTKFNGTSFTSTTYYPFFSGLDMVAVYDLADPGVGVRLFASINPAQVEDETWFNENKTSSATTNFRNRIGGFDQEALTQSYEEFVDNANLLPVYIYLDAAAQEEADHDAD